ncbi:glycosyltransferase family 2 protein [Sphingomonas sp. M1-B02]|uniref:glycosyltransferase family 2 protein n=1 Tax=Sphingomonas sp. M1-B02 TaxID=3114300 RepID=UPI002240C70E|nr:glycosyltransferase [Sphingomonas sp. S6-11]UZK65064.1 glycosyltransferase [Sphingomonas sp. S6-11]
MLIFLPVRNGADYIEEAIRSVLDQNDPDWRLIVLENGSTDATVSIVRSLADERVELLPADRSLDIVENWQRIRDWLDANDVRDQLVTTIGHDDRLNPDFVAEMRWLAETNPDATLYQSAFDLIDSVGKRIRACKPVPASETWRELAAALCWGIRDSYGTGYVFRGRDYRAVGGFPDFPKLLYADHILFVRLSRLGRKAATPAVLCHYRLHTGSTSSSLSSATLNAYVEGLDRFVEVIASEMEEFVRSVQGRDALSCLIGREIAHLGRPVVRPLLTPATRERMARLHAQFAILSPDVPPEGWISRSGSRWIRPIERLVDAAAVARLRWRERRR